MHSIVPATHMSALLTLIPETNELIWASERSGWQHLYLVDTHSGVLKNPITQGDWVVRNILQVDAANREVFIQTAGRVKGRNPYYRDICRVNLDTGELHELASSDHEYVVADPHSMQFSGQSTKGISPSGRYCVCTRSRVDQVPVSVLLDREGREGLRLETADLSALPPGWQWPEPIVVEGAESNNSPSAIEIDNQVYGVMFKPPHFSPDKSYPVLDMSFSFTEPVGSFSNNAQGDMHYLCSLAYAELGFIVVRFNNRGDFLRRNDAGVRSVAFHEHVDTRVPAHNMADCAAGIKQLCQRHAYMDSQRVGVAVYVSVPSAITGLLIYPELYSVGVSVNPGNPYLHPIDRASLRKKNSFPPLENFAANLRGKLLLNHGMLDAVLPVSTTLRMAEAFQQANKNVDMLLQPNGGHGPDAYSMRCGWDYLVRHLLGATPPDNFKLRYVAEPEGQEH